MHQPTSMASVYSLQDNNDVLTFTGKREPPNIIYPRAVDSTIHIRSLLYKYMHSYRVCHALYTLVHNARIKMHMRTYHYNIFVATTWPFSHNLSRKKTISCPVLSPSKTWFGPHFLAFACRLRPWKIPFPCTAWTRWNAWEWAHPHGPSPASGK